MPKRLLDVRAPVLFLHCWAEKFKYKNHKNIETVRYIQASQTRENETEARVAPVELLRRPWGPPGPQSTSMEGFAGGGGATATLLPLPQLHKCLAKQQRPHHPPPLHPSISLQGRSQSQCQPNREATPRWCPMSQVNKPHLKIRCIHIITLPRVLTLQGFRPQ